MAPAQPTRNRCSAAALAPPPSVGRDASCSCWELGSPVVTLERLQFPRRCDVSVRRRPGQTRKGARARVPIGGPPGARSRHLGIKSPDVLVHSVRTGPNTGVLSGPIPLRPSDSVQFAGVGATNRCNAILEGSGAGIRHALGWFEKSRNPRLDFVLWFPSGTVDEDPCFCTDLQLDVHSVHERD